MGVFEDYARYYDVYYREKDYATEVAFVLELARRHGLEPRSVLDMGCGTGRHMEEFLRAGLRADGFDLSPVMLERARQRLKDYDCQLSVGNLTSFSNGRTYDLAVSMFAVMGYLTDNDSLRAGFATARRHLRPGGLLIFDGWFGPAVLAQRPTTRRHEYTDDQGRHIQRLAFPTLDVVRERVTVRYEIGVDGQPVAEETHHMRFFFVQLTQELLAQAGLTLERVCPFLDADGVVSENTWNVTFVARAAAGNTGRSRGPEGVVP
jgi:SAM-dependent methyltransferase